MTGDEIFDWCYERLNLWHRREYYERGNGSVHTVRFSNGDSYEHIEEYLNTGRTKKRVQTILNGETVRDEIMVWHKFGWKEEQVA